MYLGRPTCSAPYSTTSTTRVVDPTETPVFLLVPSSDQKIPVEIPSSDYSSSIIQQTVIDNCSTGSTCGTGGTGTAVPVPVEVPV